MLVAIRRKIVGGSALLSNDHEGLREVSPYHASLGSLGLILRVYVTYGCRVLTRPVAIKGYEEGVAHLSHKKPSDLLT